MSLGGVSGVRPGANQAQGQGANASGESEGKEFSLGQQQQSASGTAMVKSHDVSQFRSSITQIVDRKKRNRKGSPRTVIVDDEIYEVFLIAIA